MKPSSITVFGGTGFLGRFIVQGLVDAGKRVRIAARHPNTRSEEAVESVPADVRDEASVRAAVQGVDGVVNAVGLYVERGAETFAAVHVEGAARVARETRAAGVERLVHISGIGADRSSPSNYVRARAAGEDRVRDAFEAATILRPSVLFGPGDAFLNVFDRITALSPIFPLFGSGDMRLQTVYAGDIAKAVRAALERSDCAGRTYELGGPRAYRYRELIELILRHRGRRRWLLPLPIPLWELLARILAVLPRPPLTRDQIALVREDNIVHQGMPSFAELGIAPRSLEELLSECLPDGAER